MLHAHLLLNKAYLYRGLQMCIMAGCDFLPNLPGIGIKKAHAHLKKLRSFVKVQCRESTPGSGQSCIGKTIANIH